MELPKGSYWASVLDHACLSSAHHLPMQKKPSYSVIRKLCCWTVQGRISYFAFLTLVFSVLWWNCHCVIVLWGMRVLDYMAKLQGTWDSGWAEFWLLVSVCPVDPPSPPLPCFTPSQKLTSPDCIAQATFLDLWLPVGFSQWEALARAWRQGGKGSLGSYSFEVLLHPPH